MRNLLRRFWRDTRGASLAIIAIMMTTLLSLLALSLDLGLLYTARAEAQRAADAAALAGASAFLNPGASAEQRARHYATLNDIRGVAIDPEEVSVIVFGGDSVSVRIRRESVPLWFARLFGFTASPVAASAMAGTVPASSANCVAPLAFDFAWDKAKQGELVNIAHEGSQGPGIDQYYVTLDFVQDWEDAGFEGCHSGQISILPPESVGVFPGPPRSDWAWELFTRDDAARWDATAGVVSEYGWSSPRIIKVMLREPGGSNPSQVSAKDFLLFFIESAAPDDAVVQGRFLMYASGTGVGPSETMRSVQLTR